MEEIREMLESGDATGLADRVSHAGAKLAGSKPYWQSAQKDLIAQIHAPDTGTPLHAVQQIFNGLTCTSICPIIFQMLLKMLHHIVQE